MLTELFDLVHEASLSLLKYTEVDDSSALNITKVVEKVDMFHMENVLESDTRTNGLEFVEGIWADKLAAVAILVTIAIVVVCIM